MIVLPNRRGIAGELRLIGNWHDGDAAPVGMNEAFARLFAPTRPGAEQRADGEQLAVRTERQSVRIPARRDITDDGHVFSFDNRDGVQSAASRKERLSVRGQRQRRRRETASVLVRNRATQDDFVAGGVNYGYRILVAIGYVQPVSLFVPGHR